MKTITVMKCDAKKQEVYKKEYPVIDWHRCEDELPKESGDYLVSRYGYMYDTDISDFRVCLDKKLRYVDIALFLIDFNAFDNNPRNNIYAWAEKPSPA